MQATYVKNVSATHSRSTGFVVDDAIVMIENIVRYIEAGDGPLEAARSS